MAKLIIEEDGWTHIGGQKLDSRMTIRRYDEASHSWTEGKVSLVNGVFCLLIAGTHLTLQNGDDIEIVSEAELYNREIDKRNHIVNENRAKPWLPLYDGE